MTSLTAKDYMNILTYYKINSKKKTRKEQRSIAEKLLAKKLCRCIKKGSSPKNDEKRAIGICRSSVVKKKNLKINKFRCKKKASLVSFKSTKKKLKKIHRSITKKNIKKK